MAILKYHYSLAWVLSRLPGTLANEAIAEGITDVLITFTDVQQHGIHLFYNIRKQITAQKAFLFQNLTKYKLESKALDSS